MYKPAININLFLVTLSAISVFSRSSPRVRLHVALTAAAAAAAAVKKASLIQRVSSDAKNNSVYKSIYNIYNGLFVMRGRIGQTIDRHVRLRPWTTTIMSG